MAHSPRFTDSPGHFYSKPLAMTIPLRRRCTSCFGMFETLGYGLFLMRLSSVWVWVCQQLHGRFVGQQTTTLPSCCLLSWEVCWATHRIQSWLVVFAPVSIVCI
eukprot:GHVS01019410.1.p2 GENE.GHVS01019410.1~~GHVS01019410.1.p2  ORF type:complete len:104 (-),score=12.36 GHVS01019410.1:440-751(-)